MTTEEFSNEFDTLVDSYRRFKAYDDKQELDSIEFSEYEKSIFLTQAQEQIVINLYNGKLKGEGFESTEELRANLRNLIKTVKLDQVDEGYIGISDNSYFFKLPKDLLFITYEAVTLPDDEICGGNTLSVVPVTQDDYYRTSQNPFKQANRRRALRLDNGNDIVEIISKYYINKYLVRYLSKPSPIILVNLSNLEIDGINKKTDCKLDSVLHRTILDLAVKLALSSRSVQSKE